MSTTPITRAIFFGLAMLALWMCYFLNFGMGGSQRADDLRAILSQPGVVNGTITKYRFQRASGHNGNFDRIDYEFKVNGHSIRGTADGIGTEGAPVRVTYYAENPSLHCLGDPAAQLVEISANRQTGRLVGTILTLGLGSAFMLVALFGNRKL